jgi:hypothetical protein
VAYYIDRFSSDVTGFVMQPVIDRKGVVTTYPSLPAYEQSYDIGIPSSNPQFTKLLNGGVAYSGPRRGFADVPYAWTYTGTIIVSSKQYAENAYNALAVAAHSTGRIWRTNERGTEVHYKRAYFESMKITREHGVVYRFAEPYLCFDVQIEFSILDPLWSGLAHGGGIVLDTGPGFDVGYGLDYVAANDQKTLTSTSTTWAYAVGGNRTQRRLSVLVSAGSSDLTNLILDNQTTAARCTYSGTVPANRQLLIDTIRPAVEHLAVLTSGYNPNATTLAVDSSAKATVGGAVSIVLTNGEIFTTTIESISSGTSITIPSPGLPSSANSSARVGYGGYISNTGVRLFSPLRQDWFSIGFGTNTIVITRTGGGTNAMIGLSFREANV